MSEAQPPTEQLPIFNPVNFPDSSPAGIGGGGGSGSYLNFPVAQGIENFPSGITYGDGTYQNSAGAVGNGIGVKHIANCYRITDANTPPLDTGNLLNVAKIPFTGGNCPIWPKEWANSPGVSYTSLDFQAGNVDLPLGPFAEQNQAFVSGNPANAAAYWTDSDIIYIRANYTVNVFYNYDENNTNPFSQAYTSGSNSFVGGGIWALKPFMICYGSKNPDYYNGRTEPTQWPQTFLGFNVTNDPGKQAAPNNAPGSAMFNAGWPASGYMGFDAATTTRVPNGHTNNVPKNVELWNVLNPYQSNNYGVGFNSTSTVPYGQTAWGGYTAPCLGMSVYSDKNSDTDIIISCTGVSQTGGSGGGTLYRTQIVNLDLEVVGGPAFTYTPSGGDPNSGFYTSKVGLTMGIEMYNSQGGQDNMRQVTYNSI